MPPPTNNQAATTDLGTAYAEFGTAYDPQVAQVNKQITDLGTQQQTAQTQLDQAKANAFKTIGLNSNAKGLLFSGYTPANEASYTKNTYDPSVQKLNTTTAAGKQSLLDKITAINQERSNAAYGLVQNTKQAQTAAAAKRVSSSRSSGGSSGSSQWQTVYNDLANTRGSNGMPSIGKDGYANPTSYNTIKAAFVAQGGSSSSFDSQFKSLKNPDQKNHSAWEQYR